MSSITGSRHNCEQGQPKLQLGGVHSLPGLPQQRNHRGGAGKGTTTGTTPQGGGGDTMGWGGEGGCGSPASYMSTVCRNFLLEASPVYNTLKMSKRGGFRVGSGCQRCF